MAKIARFRVFTTPDSACAQLASEIALLIRERAILGRKTVLGLAVGRTHLPLYEELIYLHKEESLSFENVVTFNLDEYHGVEASHPASFRSFMQENFFDHINIRPKNIHFLAGNVATEKIPALCTAYEKKILATGGIDFQILGIHRDGDIGFIQPETPIDTRTQRVQIDESVRQDAADLFDGIENVPTHALTMGCATILKARKIVLLAWGASKSNIVRRAVEGTDVSTVGASFLKIHPSAQFYLNPPAASLLKNHN